MNEFVQKPASPVVHLNWGTPGTLPGLNGAACDRLFWRGRDSVAGPKDIQKVTCEDCQAIYERWTHPKPMTFEDKVRMIANTGEGSTYGALDWVALGVLTFGIGIPVVWFLKPYAKAYIARLEKEREKELAEE